jgi:hypothetical protein
VTYIREFDRATMIEIAPHCYLNETAARKQFSDSTKHSDISAESTNSVDCSSLIPLRDRLAGLTFLHHHRRTAEADPCSLRAVWSG